MRLFVCVCGVSCVAQAACDAVHRHENVQDAEPLLIITGTIRRILSICSFVFQDGERLPLTFERREKIVAMCAATYKLVCTRYCQT